MQMNFVITPEFEEDLFDLMMHARIRKRSEAVRHAVHMLAEVMRDRVRESEQTQRSDRR